MSTGNHSRGVVLLVSGLALSAVVAGPPEDPPKVCQNPVLGIIEGPDPISGRCAWETATSAAWGDVGDPPGLLRRAARDPRSGRVVEVWAAPASGDHDIALAEWDGQEPPRVTYLTAALSDDLDPRALFDAEGMLHVVWWSRGERDEVVYARRDATGRGWSPDRVVGVDARRPALTVVDGAAWLAFERSGVAATEIVLGEPGPEGEIALSVAARSSSPSITGLSVSVVLGRPRIEWTESDGRVVGAERWGSAWIRHDIGAPGR